LDWDLSHKYKIVPQGPSNSFIKPKKYIAATLGFQHAQGHVDDVDDVDDVEDVEDVEEQIKKIVESTYSVHRCMHILFTNK
jgi:hypothetical protein